MIKTETRVALLKKIHLFSDLSDEELQVVAEQFSEAEYAAGEVIFEQGGKAESFYLIVKGKVGIVRKRDKREQQLATLVNNDYFGEMALVSKRARSATVTALIPTTLLVLPLENFNELLRNNPKLKPNLDVTIRSRSLAQTLQFKWLRADEVVYFLARKHPILLYQAMVVPALVLLAPIFLAVWSLLAKAVTPVAVGTVILILDLGWAIWLWVDWGNDYYVVTNERVVWLEKVIGLYDSRQEAPLSTILSVSVETDLWGRALDYGNVIVRTFVGRIPFNHVTHPNQAAHVIEEYWQRTKQNFVSAEKDAMKNALRTRLGLTVAAEPAATAPATVTATATSKASTRQLIFKALGANTLKMRYEVGDTVIYHKHWIVLLQQTWQPAAFIIALTGLLVSRIISVAFDPNITLLTDTISLSLPILMIPFILWLVYQIADWSNDIFEVTLDQIIDHDRTPFGTEERRAAQLENILGTQYTREGLIGNIFNFGTVFITVGGTQLAFEDVLDPATVQSDIDRRRMTRMAKANDIKVAAERDRMADWLTAYHQNADEFRAQSGSSDTERKTE